MDRNSCWAQHVADVAAGCHETLLRVARKRLHDDHDAEDAVQDTILYLLEHPRDRAIGPRYLRVCVRNHCLKVLCRRYEDRQEVPRVLDFLLLFDPADLPDDERFEERCRWLQASIARLSRAEQKVVRPFIHGQSLEEIASRQNAKPETVKRTYRRAIDRLGRIAREGVAPRRKARPRRPAPLVHRTRMGRAHVGKTL